MSDKGIRNKEEELGSKGEMKDLLLSYRLAGWRVERAWDLRGRDCSKASRNIALLGADPWEGGPKSARISVVRGQSCRRRGGRERSH